MKQQSSPKLAPSIILFIMGTGFFILSPLWVGLFIIAPIFLTFIYYIMNGEIVMESVDHSQRYKSSSSASKTYRPSSISSQSHLLGCHSLSQRKDRYGF